MPHTFDSKDDAQTSADPRPHRILSAMMNQGRSFSGNERNCCFLNIGSANRTLGKFANISAGSGLDFPDDGRGVAVTDWDADGDLDLWISNRNAPRLRYMRNDTRDKNHFLGLRLAGNGKDTNRDAVGARVAVYVVRESGRTKLIRTLRAGEGFLSQSSKWLHFGLGATETIEKVVVQWPCQNTSDGQIEQFTGLAVDRRYLLSQGFGRPVEVSSRRTTLPLRPSVPKLPAPTQTARIPAVTLLRGPRLRIRAESGEIVSPGAGNPVLINLFASWCPACLQELTQIRDHEAEIRAAGIQIIALSVDGLAKDDNSPAETAQQTLQEMDFPFPSAMASSELLASLQGYHNAMVTLHTALPLPSSFLIDGAGRVAVMYKGPMEIDDLLVDARHPQGTRAERWQRSALLPGRTIQHARVTRTAENVEAAMHFQYGLHQEKQSSLEDATYHFRQALRFKSDFALARRHLGRVYLMQNDAREAESHLRHALQMTPDDPEIHYLLAKSFLQQQEPAKARSHYEEAVRCQSDHVPAMFDLAAMLHTLEGRVQEAVTLYRAVLEIDADHVSAQNNLAWLLATHPDEQFRDGQEALRLAQHVVQQTGGDKPFFLDLLAAAQAECGQFEESVATARQAKALAQAANDLTLAAEIQNRLENYEKKQAYREWPIK